jgi:3-methyladenine DNA glycosylase AlkD
MNSPARASVIARHQLAAMGRSAGHFDAARYFRGPVDLGFYNVRTVVVRRMARDLWHTTDGAWSLDDAVEFADRMLRDRHLEAKGLGLELLARHRRAFRPSLLPVCKRWLVANLAANWATTDLLCGSVIAPLLLQQPALAERTMPLWARHRNMWVRRSSAVALVPAARSGLLLDTAYAVAHTLRCDSEDLVRKAAGWLLREAGRSDPERLRRFLLEHGQGMARTTVRYAVERFPQAQRRRLLERTRPGGGARPRA